MGLADLARVTDLFVEGTELAFDPGEAVGPPLLLWVNKLNSFEREEAQRDGTAARARVVLAMRELGSAEYLAFDAVVSEMDDEKLRAAIADQKANEMFVAVMDSMRQEKEWREKVEAVTRVSDDLSREEQEAVDKINLEYADEVQRRITSRREGLIQELCGLDSTALREKYREGWLDARAYGAFQREYVKTQLYFAVRVCKGVRTDVGTWDHAGCDQHRQRALDSRDEVPRLPDGLLELLTRTSQSVEVQPRDARFSAALASSSASSAQPSAVEESPASTPEVTSPEPATISS